MRLYLVDRAGLRRWTAARTIRDGKEGSTEGLELHRMGQQKGSKRTEEFGSTMPIASTDGRKTV